MPSSLATVLSLTSGSSPCLPVSVLVRAVYAFARSFSREPVPHASLLDRSFASLTRLHVLMTGFAWSSATSLRPQSVKRVMPAVSVTPFTPYTGTGISACFPSTTPFGLALGPDLPRADEPSPGILRLSVYRILTCISLLTPAFSLPCSPPLLTVRLLSACNAPLPLINRRIRSFGIRLSPGTFSAQGHSTSELLRTLSRMAASEPTS